uniref:Dual specificity phosphatase 22 n=1 Tax=Ficedula albicollis TaxID=59894 RepID=A0A803VAB7_FICAL
MGNGMNKILPGLFIGNFKDARDVEQLSKNNITHILSIHDSARPMLERGEIGKKGFSRTLYICDSSFKELFRSVTETTC